MKGNVFMSSLKAVLRQNGSRDFFDDSTYYAIVTEGLQDIFFILNTKKIWGYSFVEETLSAVDGTDGLVYHTTYPIL